MNNLHHADVLNFAKLIFAYKHDNETYYEPFSEIASLYEAPQDTIVFAAASAMQLDDANTYVYLPDMICEVTREHAKSADDAHCAGLFLADAMKNLFYFELDQPGDFLAD